MSTAKILLLEDDEVLGSTIVEILQEAGYSIDLAKDGEQAADLSYDNQYDLYIFDINVPEINGIELLKDLRHAGDNTPTIYITALIDLESITKAFDAGAEDYLKKPFFPQELLLRVDSRLKNDNKQNIITYKSITYYPDTKEVYKDGKIISLGTVQIRLFDLLMHNIGKLTLKEALLDLLDQPSNTALRVAMAKLKQKLEIDITNVRGQGYILEKA
jgi:DNA-binding response OmpR family regulator